MLMILTGCINHLIIDYLFVKTNRSPHNFLTSFLILNKTGHRIAIAHIDNCLHMAWHWFGLLSQIVWGNMKAHFSDLNKTISDLVPSAFCSSLKLVQWSLHCPFPLHTFMSYTAANSAYLQTTSINSDTHRTRLKHENSVLCTHKLLENVLARVLAHSS